MRTGFVATAVAIVMVGMSAAAQTAALATSASAVGPAFEVASVRPAAAMDQATIFAGLRAGKRPEEMHVDGDRVTFRYYSLKQLISVAYNVQPVLITGPDWMSTDRFDVAAKMPDGASRDDVPAMLKALLEERFKMTAQLETKDRAVLGLMLGKNGLKMKEVAARPPLDEHAELKPGQSKVDSTQGAVILTRNPDRSTTYDMGSGGTMTLRVNGEAGTMDMNGTAMSMKGLAARMTSLGSGNGRPVVDLTGLTGNYDVQVVFALSELVSGLRDSGINIPTGAPDPNEPSGTGTVADALDKLGLRLQNTHAPVVQLTVDHVEKLPTEN